MTKINNDELQHYGVVGMKWGVRRASKQLSSGNKKAADTLKKYRSQSLSQIDKLETKNQKLSVKKEKARSKAELYRQKADKRYLTSIGEGLTESRLKKMRKFDRKEMKYDKKILKNQKLQEALLVNINEIDDALVSKGKKFING